MNPAAIAALNCPSILIPIAITAILWATVYIVWSDEDDRKAPLVMAVLWTPLVWAIWLIYAVVTLSKVASAT